MTESAGPRIVGLNHIALEVGDIEEALAFYGRIFQFELRGKNDAMAFIDLGDQFIALQKGRKQSADGGRHFGLVVDDKEAARRTLHAAGVAGKRAISLTSAIPGVTALRSSATTIFSSPRRPMFCGVWV